MKKKLYTLIYVFLSFLLNDLHAEQWQVSHYTTRNGLASNVVNTVFQDQEGYIWFGTNYGLSRFDGYTFVNFYCDEKGSKQIENVTSIVEDRNNRRLWIDTSSSGIHCMDLNNMSFIAHKDSLKTFPEIRKQHAEVRAMAHKRGITSRNATGRREYIHMGILDDGREIYTTIDNGFYVYHPHDGSLTHYCSTDTNPLIESDYITDIMIDKNGEVWLTTYMAGIYKLHTNKETWQYHRLTPNMGTNDTNSVRSFAQLADGDIAIATMDGRVYKYDIRHKTFELLHQKEQRVYAIATDHMNRLWLGTRGGGVWIDKRKLTVEDGLHAKIIFDILIDESQNIWIASLDNGLIRARQKSDEMYSFNVFMPQERCHDLDIDQDGRLWIATENGLFVMKNKEIHHLYHEGGVRCVYCAKNGQVLAGTVGHGIIIVTDSETGTQINSITTNDGLSNNSVSGIIADNNENIIISTDEGFSIINATNGSIHNLYSQHGTLANVYNECANLKTDNGKILLGSLNGFIELDSICISTIINENIPIGETHITSIEINGKPYYAYDIDNLELEHDMNNLRFTFSSLTYQKLPSVNYSYKLEGLDKEWQLPIKENYALYNNLSPGKYIFRVRSSNNGKQWTEETICNIYIAKPFWNSGWAWFIYISVATIILTYVLYILQRTFRLYNDLAMERRVLAFQEDFYDRIEREFRNPLNVLQGATEQVRTSGASKTTVRNIRRGSKRLLELLKMMEEFRHTNRIKSENDQKHMEIEQRFKDIATAIHTEEEEMKELAPPPLNKLKIMLVEPDEDNLAYLTETLNELFHVEPCTQYEDCITKVAEQQPRAIIIDISLDVNGGRKLTGTLKKDKATRHIPIVHISAYNETVHEISSLRSGADAYIVKPYNNTLLIEKTLLLIKSIRHTATDIDNNEILITSDYDRRFLTTLERVVANNLHNPDFDVKQMAIKIGYSRAHLVKKVKELKGTTPSAYLRKERMKLAGKLISEKRMTITEVMYKVGITDAGNFYRRFKEHFGASPAQYGKSSGSTV